MVSTVRIISHWNLFERFNFNRLSPKRENAYFKKTQLFYRVIVIHEIVERKIQVIDVH